MVARKRPVAHGWAAGELEDGATRPFLVDDELEPLAEAVRDRGSRADPRDANDRGHVPPDGPPGPGQQQAEEDQQGVRGVVPGRSEEERPIQVHAQALPGRSLGQQRDGRPATGQDGDGAKQSFRHGVGR
nr:hypothetical protein [Tenggerimyces flavus]